MKMKKPKKMIEAKKDDIVLICTLGKSSMIIARRMKNGKYESKLTNGYIGDNKIFDSVDDVLEQIQMMVKAHESVIESEIGDLKSEDEKRV